MRLGRSTGHYVAMAKSDLLRSHEELRAALRLAGAEIRNLNFGRSDTPVLKLLRRVLRESPAVASTEETILPKPILVVEDVEETRDGLEKLLTAHGYRVDPARDEKDAVRRAKHDSPALILMSLGGPQNELIATASRIRDLADLSETVPIVLFCSEALAEGAEVEIERNTYLTWPDNFDQLRHLISRVLSNTWSSEVILT